MADQRFYGSFTDNVLLVKLGFLFQLQYYIKYYYLVFIFAQIQHKLVLKYLLKIEGFHE